MNILGQISELRYSKHTSDLRTIQQLHNIKRLAEKNANMLAQILYDYIRQNQDEPTYRKARFGFGIVLTW
jgi:hypothetical protein